MTNPSGPYSINPIETVLQNQLEYLLQGLGSNQRNLHPSITIDESKGPVHIVDGTRIGPSVHIEGPRILQVKFVMGHMFAVIHGSVEMLLSVMRQKSNTVCYFQVQKAPHFNYVGDSILGTGVNLGAGCKLSNLRNDGRHIRIHNLSMDTGLRKFNAILGEGVQIGCNAGL